MSGLDPQHDVEQVLAEDDQQRQGFQQELGVGAVWLLKFAKDVVKL